MYDTFFKNNFASIKGVSTDERRDEIIRSMVVEFTMHTLSTIDSVDYVVPNYVRKMLNNFTYEYIETPDPEYVYVKVYFPDFEVKFEEKYPLKQKERELRQKIKKYTKLNAVVLDYGIDVKDVFTSIEPNEVIDVVVIKDDEPYASYDGGDIYIRDKYCPYLIHKYLCYDNDVFTAIRDTNRTIEEFLSKFEHQYNTSFFL